MHLLRFGKIANFSLRHCFNSSPVVIDRQTIFCILHFNASGWHAQNSTVEIHWIARPASIVRMSILMRAKVDCVCYVLSVWTNSTTKTCCCCCAAESCLFLRFQRIYFHWIPFSYSLNVAVVPVAFEMAKIVVVSVIVDRFPNANSSRRFEGTTWTTRQNVVGSRHGRATDKRTCTNRCMCIERTKLANKPSGVRAMVSLIFQFANFADVILLAKNRNGFPFAC